MGVAPKNWPAARDVGATACRRSLMALMDDRARGVQSARRVSAGDSIVPRCDTHGASAGQREPARDERGENTGDRAAGRPRAGLSPAWVGNGRLLYYRFGARAPSGAFMPLARSVHLLAATAAMLL